jgi:hypothetical protein
MKLHIPLRRWALLAGLSAVGLIVQGCASGPKSGPVTPVVHTPAAPAPAKGQMAPIPNPPEEQKAPPPAPAAPVPHPAVKPAAPKPARPAARPPGQTPAGPTPADVAQAAKLRASGLEQLNRGAVDKAVALLQQASQLDPNSDLIKRDLERALRISQVVHTKP